MAWKKPPESLIKAFLAALPDDPQAQRRKMFGFPCCFVNGQMFTGVHQDSVVVRLPQEQRDELIASGGAPFVPMPGRTMKEYIVVPVALQSDPAGLALWISKAFDYARSLPPKAATNPGGPRAAPRRRPVLPS
ncbi:MAG: TfoX/Sxy family protein [Candidatus Riflebacteria bacterium]|nr:TfoX/Sxy family protein [Candidatus Riflebacteria bacterium]